MKNLVIKTNFRIVSKVVMKAFGIFNLCVYSISPTLHNPVDGNLPGSFVHGISQARILEWVTILFSRDLPDPGIKPGSPTLQVDSLPSELPRKRLKSEQKLQKGIQRQRVE